MIRSIGTGAVATLCLTLAGWQQGAAQEFSSADRAKVEARIAELDRSISSGNVAGAFDVIPPRLFTAIAQRAGATEEQLRAVVRQTLETAMQGVTFVSYDMDLAAAPPTLTPDGKRTYLLIPTTSLIELANGSRVKSTTATLALQDEGEWYLIRIDDQNQVAIVRELWPEFGPVQFPTGTAEAQ